MNARAGEHDDRLQLVDGLRRRLAQHLRKFEFRARFRATVYLQLLLALRRHLVQRGGQQARRRQSRRQLTGWNIGVTRVLEYSQGGIGRLHAY